MGRRNGELFNGYRVSVLQNGMNSGDWLSNNVTAFLKKYLFIWLSRVLVAARQS